MTDILKLISGLPSEHQRRVLAEISHNLTVVARDYAYKISTQDTEVNIQRLRSLNEMQHQISGSLMKAAEEYPIADVIRSIRTRAEAEGMAAQLEWVETQVVRRILAAHE